MKSKLLFFLLLLLLPITLAQEFSSYNLEISLTPSGVAHQRIQNTFALNKNADSVLFLTNSDIQNINIVDSIEGYSLTDKGLLIKKNIKANQENNILIEFDSKGLVKQSGKDFIFSLDPYLPFDPKQTRIKLNLPEGFILSDIDSPISPKPSKIETDGKIITIVWDLNINEGSFIVIYKRGYISKVESLLPLYTSFITIIAILTIVTVFLLQKRKNKMFISETLSEAENKILSLIRTEAEITQKQIRKITGFSKSKLSKIVYKMEQKGVLKRIPHFKTNKFKLPKNLK